MLVVLDLLMEASLRFPYATSYNFSLPPLLNPSESDIAYVLLSLFFISCLLRLVFKDAELYNLEDPTLA